MRYTRAALPVIIGLLLAGCSSGPDAGENPPQAHPPDRTPATLEMGEAGQPSLSPSTTTTPPNSTTGGSPGPIESGGEEARESSERPSLHQVAVSTVEFMPGLVADVHAPTMPGDYQVVTLTFGRGWSIGDRRQMSALADFLASGGIVAINGEYRTLARGGRLSSMAGEVSCLAAAAPQLSAPHLTRPAGPVWLLGYSAGAHLAALATLGDPPEPSQCPHDPGRIAGMIGLGGPYDMDELWTDGLPGLFLERESVATEASVPGTEARQQGIEAMRFFLRLLTGAVPDDGEEWKALNPLDLAEGRPSRSFLLVAGAEDEMVHPRHSERFAEALRSGGHQVSLQIISRSGHRSLTDPEKVGEVILSFLGGVP